jgi:hypothetical protein
MPAPLVSPLPGAAGDTPVKAPDRDAAWSPSDETAAVFESAPAPMSAPFDDEPFSLGDEPPAPPPPIRRSEAPAHAGAGAARLDAGAIDDAMVERIAARVVAKLTGDQIERIAWEVVPEVAEALIRKRITEIEARLADE